MPNRPPSPPRPSGGRRCKCPSRVLPVTLVWLGSLLLLLLAFCPAGRISAQILGDISDTNSPAQIVRETHFAPKGSRVAKLSNGSTSAFQGAGTYVGSYSVIVGGTANFATITLQFNQQGQLVDWIGSGGRIGTQRPLASSGSVDASGSIVFVTDFSNEHGVWRGSVRGRSASGTASFTYADGSFKGSATWWLYFGLDTLAPDPGNYHADPVDTSSGAYVAKHTLLSQNCPTGLAFTIEYNSTLRFTGGLGAGWSHNFEMRVDDVGSAQTLIFNWNQNRRNYFTRVGATGDYTCADRAMRYDTLTKNADGTFTLKRADQSRMQFNSSGRLLRLQNPHGQNTELIYDAAGTMLLGVKDTISGMVLAFGYDASGRINLVTDRLTRTVTFDYTASDTLNYWLLKDSANVGVAAMIYTYDAAGRILTVKDGDGVVFVTNTYDEGGRVVIQDDALADSRLTKFAYDDTSVPDRLVTTVTDRNGKSIVYTFDRKYQLLSLRNQNGETVTHTYDADGNRLSTVDALNRMNKFAYDGQGNLVAITDPANAVVAMRYDGSNNLIAIRNAAGKESRFGYDSRNNLIAATNALNEFVRWTFDTNSLLLQRTSPRGGVTVYAYSTNGLPVSVRDPNTNTTLLAYDAAGRLTSTTDALGKSHRFTYRADDVLLSVTDPLNNKVTYTYDTRRRKLTETNPLNKTSRFTYDGNGNLRSVTDALGNRTLFAYDYEDRLIRTTDPRGGTTTMQYDPAGGLIAVTDAVGQTRNLRYDAAGNLIDQLDARGNRTRFTPDSRNLITSVLDPHARQATNVFDSLRRLARSANPLGEARQFAYDDLDRLIAVTDPLNQVASQTYDADGNRVAITNARNAVTAFAHDLAGRLTSITVPGNRTTAYGYDSRNLLTAITEPSGQKADLTYDEAGRLLQLADPVGSIAYTYDAAGRVLTVKQGAATISRVYDDVGRLIQFTDASSNVLKYAYDAAGNLTTLTYPDNKTVTYTYDAANRLSTVKDWANRTTTYTYDPDGRLATTTRPNGTVETRTWLPTGELASLTDTKGASVISSFTYSYDLAGRILAEAPVPTPSAVTPAGFTATYDLGNRLTSFNAITTAFDADGNMTTGPDIVGTASATFAYDARNRLTSFAGTSYAYDAENRRTSLTDGIGTTTFVINPNASLTQVLVRTAPGGTVTRAVYGLGLLYEETGSLARYYHCDYRGSAVAFSDASGTVTGRVEYGPFGEIASHTGDTATPYLFNARYGVMADPNGLFYMRARYYHPTIRRFVNQDTVMGDFGNGVSLNRFAYANGNPVSLIDPFGMAADSDGGGGGGSLWDGLSSGSWSSGADSLWGGLGNAWDRWAQFSADLIDLNSQYGFNPLRTGVELGTGKNPYTLEEVSRARAGFDAFLDIGAPGAGRALGWLAGRAGAYGAKGLGYQNTLFKNALQRFNDLSEISHAGRALTKHPELIGLTKDTLRQSLRTDSALNQAAQAALKDIIRNGIKTNPTLGRYGTITQMQTPGGFGARWYQNGDFIGFINP